MSHDAHLVLLAGILLAAGVGSSLLASALRLPALLLFLGVGMAVGSDGLNWIYLNDYKLARLIGTVALIVILYEGGLQTGFQKLRPVLAPAISLAVVGTALTALIAGLAAAWLLHFSVTEGLLLGAILSPTDGAAVFSLLRGVRMPERMVLMLEGEAGLNDPVAVVGTALTALIAGLAAAWLLNFSVAEGLLLGAILSPTDGAAVFSLLRGVRMPERMVLMLEGEAGLNDPVAVALVIVMVEVVSHGGYTVLHGVWFFVHEMGIGAVIGAAVGWLARIALKRMSSAPAGLTLVGSFATAALAYGAAGSLDGSGFLAVYIAALMVGDGRLRYRDELNAFHEGFAQVAEMGMFFTLGLLVFPSQLGSVLGSGTVLALVVAFVARPLATFVATIHSKLRLPERALLGWAGLRGGVPVVLATFPVIDHIRHSVEFFDLVFFAVLVSTLVQGATVAPLAQRLRS